MENFIVLCWLCAFLRYTMAADRRTRQTLAHGHLHTLRHLVWALYNFHKEISQGDLTMQIQVRLFATLRQLAGWSQQPLELPEGATLDDALAAIDARYPALTIGKRTFYAAVNQEYAKGDQVLREGDEVAIFPPVSGGSCCHIKYNGRNRHGPTSIILMG